MKPSSRRFFVRQASAISATLACTRKMSLRGQTTHASPPIRAWITAGDVRFGDLTVAPWQATTTRNAPDVEIHFDRRFQSILGFGGAFTDSSCYLLSRMETTQRQQLLEELLESGGLGLSMGRTCIGASDYSRSAYSFDDSPAPSGTQNLQHRA